MKSCPKIRVLGRYFAFLLGTALAMMVAAGTSADPPSGPQKYVGHSEAVLARMGVNNSAFVAKIDGCMNTWLAVGEGLTSIFPDGVGLVQVPLDHNALFVGIDEERGQAFIQCHGEMPRGVPVLGIDIFTGNVLEVVLLTNPEVCALGAQLDEDFGCRGNGRGMIINNFETTGAICPLNEFVATTDWKTINAPSGQTTLTCFFRGESTLPPP